MHTSESANATATAAHEPVIRQHVHAVSPATATTADCCTTVAATSAQSPKSNMQTARHAG